MTSNSLPSAARSKFYDLPVDMMDWQTRTGLGGAISAVENFHATFSFHLIIEKSFVRL